MPSYRFNTVQQLSSASNLQPAASYTVQAYEPGAQVTSVTGTPSTFTVRAGHGFAAGDKFLLRPGTDNVYSGTEVVASVTATTIVMTSGTYTASAQDYLFNLGSDSTGGSPSFDGDARVTIYSDMGCTQAITNSALTTNSDGEYFYWHNGPRNWELVRSGSTVVAILPDAVAPADLVRYANQWATDGVGTSGDPWTGWELSLTSATSGSRIHFPQGYYLKFPQIDAVVDPMEEFASGRIYFRSAISPEYSVDLVPAVGGVAGTLPAPTLEATYITYYLQVSGRSLLERKTPEITARVVEKASDCDGKVAAVVPVGPSAVLCTGGLLVTPAGFGAGAAAGGILGMSTTTALVVGGFILTGGVITIIVTSGDDETAPPASGIR